jgi:hypothetical protein
MCETWHRHTSRDTFSKKYQRPVLAFPWITDENHDKFDTIPGTSADNEGGCHQTTN